MDDVLDAEIQFMGSQDALLAVMTQMHISRFAKIVSKKVDADQ